MRSRLFLWPMYFVGFLSLSGLGYPAEAGADLYRWTDTRGVIHIVDESVEIPETYQGRVKIYRSVSSDVASSPALITPSREYAARSQGAFAQKIAVDFGLIEDGSIDALGPLNGVGIRPAGGWQVSRNLDPDSIDQLAAAVRRAATPAPGAFRRWSRSHYPPGRNRLYSAITAPRPRSPNRAGRCHCRTAPAYYRGHPRTLLR